jgi:hypothetical protein
MASTFIAMAMVGTITFEWRQTLFNFFLQCLRAMFGGRGWKGTRLKSCTTLRSLPFDRSGVFAGKRG